MTLLAHPGAEAEDKVCVDCTNEGEMNAHTIRDLARGLRSIVSTHDTNGEETINLLDHIDEYMDDTAVWTPSVAQSNFDEPPYCWCGHELHYPDCGYDANVSYPCECGDRWLDEDMETMRKRYGR